MASMMQSQEDSLDSITLRHLQREVLDMDVSPNLSFPSYPDIGLHPIAAVAGGDHFFNSQPPDQDSAPVENNMNTSLSAADPGLALVAGETSPGTGPSRSPAHEGRPSQPNKALSTPRWSGTSRSEHDTQPMPGSVFDAYVKKIVRSQEARAAVRAGVQALAPLNEMADGSGPADLPGQIELFQDFEQDRSHLSRMGAVIPDSDSVHDPETPALNPGKKRNYEGEVVDHFTTPSLPLNPFAARQVQHNGIMALSQVFNATQTSPLDHNGLTSDPLSQRPSPDIYAFRAPVVAPSSSSPLQSIHQDDPSLVDHATTFEAHTPSSIIRAEALETRQNTHWRQASPSVRGDRGESSTDDDLNPDEEIRIRRKLRLEKIERDTRRRLEMVSVPRRPLPVAARSRSRSRRTSDEARGPLIVSGDHRQALRAVLHSDPVHVGGREAVLMEDSEGETFIQDYARPGSQGEGDNLSMDEADLGQVQVPMTTRRQPAPRSLPGTQTIAATQGSPSMTRDTGTHRRSASQGDILATQSDGAETGTTHIIGSDPTCVVRGTQTSAVDNSQPPRSITHRRSNDMPGSGPPQLPDLPSSMDASNAAACEVVQSNHLSDPASLAEPEEQNGNSSSIPQPPITSDDAASPLPPLRHMEKPRQVAKPETMEDHEPIQQPSVGASGPITQKGPFSKVLFNGHQTQLSSTTTFNTAHTHFDYSPVKPHSPESSAAAPAVLPIHQLGPTRIRTLTEIAADPSPPSALEDVDLDIQLLDHEDVEFQRAMDGSSPMSPAKKRRKAREDRVLRETKQRSNQYLAPPQSARGHYNQPLPVSPRPDDTPSEWHPKPEGHLARTIKKADGTAFTSRKTYTSKIKLKSRSKAKGVEKGGDSTLKLPPPADPTDGLGSVPDGPQVVGPGKQGIDASHICDPRVGAVEAGEDELSVSNLISPNRVLAWFRGGTSSYYPATCLSVQGPDQTRFKVRFDDGTIDIIDSHHIRSLDLRSGDVVKVDLPQKRTKNWVVTGFDTTPASDTSDAQSNTAIDQNGQIAFPLTDIRGHFTALLTPKQRDSLGPDGVTSGDVVPIPITSIYIVQSNWINFKDRLYTHRSDGPRARTGIFTPQEQPSTPGTPSSRDRRVTPTAQTQGVIGPAKARVGGKIFENMVFAVSYVSRETEKGRVMRMIRDHGGRVLTEGFEELFHFHDSSTEPALAPSDPATTPLRLTSEGEAVGFACLIADQHSRRAKYMQALALGLPCLAGRWIEDCVGKGKVLGWDAYLLPAGESTFLHGAVRSRTLPSTPPLDARFASTIANRRILLDGRTVLLVMGRGKAEERRRAYLFLTYALGASRVGKVSDVQAARKALLESTETAADETDGRRGWDWVYVDHSVPEARKTIFSGSLQPATTTAQKGRIGKGKSKGQKEEKRKRGVETMEEQRRGSWGREAENGSGSGSGSVQERLKRVKVVGDEFVVQSLILGALVPDGDDDDDDLHHDNDNGEP